MNKKGFVFILMVFLFATIVQGIADAVTAPLPSIINGAQNKIYWVEHGSSVDEVNDGKIRCANHDGSDVQDLVTNGLTAPWGIALDVDSGKMYWTDWTEGTIERSGFERHKCPNAYSRRKRRCYCAGCV